MGLNTSSELESLTNANLLAEDPARPAILGGVIFNNYESPR
jgi:hypothetical protein